MVIIMQGISGAGKDTVIEAVEVHPALKDGIDITFSADHGMYNKGIYCFDPKKLDDCHGSCLRQYVLWLSEYKMDQTVVISNTNCTLMAITQYVNLAIAFGHEYEIVTVMCNPQVAFKRNVHGTPQNVIMKQHVRLLQCIERMPPRWKQRFIWND